MSLYKILFFGGLILWWVETAYFGWNKTPGSALESMLDLTSTILIFYGAIGDISRNLTIKKDTIINTQTVEIKK